MSDVEDPFSEGEAEGIVFDHGLAAMEDAISETLASLGYEDWRGQWAAVEFLMGCLSAVGDDAETVEVDIRVMCEGFAAVVRHGRASTERPPAP